MIKFKNHKSSTILGGDTVSISREDTISPDQVDDLLQERVVLRDGKPARKCLCNKAADTQVNAIPAPRSDMGSHNIQSGISCRIACDCPENTIQDHGEVYDVTHHASNIFLAGSKRLSHLAIILCAYSPPSIFIINPIRELVGGSVPVRTIGNSICWTSPLIVRTLTPAMCRQLARLDL